MFNLVEHSLSWIAVWLTEAQFLLLLPAAAHLCFGWADILWRNFLQRALHASW